MQNVEHVLSGLAPILIGDTHSAQILDALPVAVYATDPEGRITYYNQAAADFWGCEPALGQTYWCGSFKLYRPDGTPLPHDECPMAMSAEDRRPVRGLEAIVERADGTRVPFMPYPTPIFDPSGAMIGAVNMLLDISETEAGRARCAASRGHCRIPPTMPSSAKTSTASSSAGTGARSVYSGIARTRSSESRC